MNSFASDIQLVCITALLALVCYTLWLSRYRGLDGHVTVRWVIVEGAALLTVAFWRWLPFFNFTSGLEERQLLLIVTVVLFAFVVFLMLDLLVRNSRQSVHIKRLTQELAIQTARIDLLTAEPDSLRSRVPVVAATSKETVQSGLGIVQKMIACLWIVACIGFFAAELAFYDSPIYPSALKRALTANYLQ